MKDDEASGREIQESIRQVLFDYWDPFGVNELCRDRSEYDHLLAPVHRKLCSNPTEDELMQFLAGLEGDDSKAEMLDYGKQRNVAAKLLQVDIRL